MLEPTLRRVFRIEPARQFAHEVCDDDHVLSAAKPATLIESSLIATERLRSAPPFVVSAPGVAVHPRCSEPGIPLPERTVTQPLFDQGVLLVAEGGVLVAVSGLRAEVSFDQFDEAARRAGDLLSRVGCELFEGADFP